MIEQVSDNELTEAEREHLRDIGLSEAEVKLVSERRIRNQTLQSALVDHETRVMALELDRRLLDSAQGLADIVQGLLTRIETLENKATRLEHHFVTLDKQLSKQARRIEELEAAQARQGDSE